MFTGARPGGLGTITSSLDLALCFGGEDDGINPLAVLYPAGGGMTVEPGNGHASLFKQQAPGHIGVVIVESV
jgi:hypothetical protein